MIGGVPRICLMCLLGTMVVVIMNQVMVVVIMNQSIYEKPFIREKLHRNNRKVTSSLIYHYHEQPTSSDMEKYFSYPSIDPNMTQDLIDFAVAGFAKSGTTFLARGILGPSPHINMGAKDKNGVYQEMCHLAYGNLSGFLSYFPSHKSPSMKYGFKEPLSLFWEPSLYHMSTYFPKAKLIVSVRHPIHWFQSLYNYKMRLDKRFWSDLKITPYNRIGECSLEMPFRFSKWLGCKSNQTCVTYKPGFGCTDRSNFHVHLSRLGWTPRSSTRELTLLDQRLVNTFNFSQSRMFLMENNQLDYGKNETRTNALIHDLESFLELESGSLNAEQLSQESITTNHVDKADISKEHILKRFISICNDEYRDLRTILLRQAQYVILFSKYNLYKFIQGISKYNLYKFIQGCIRLDPRVFHIVSVSLFCIQITQSHIWIQLNTLTNINCSEPSLPSCKSHVFVSDRDYFIHLLKQWHMDPCDNPFINMIT
jgi:hypothetical protein